MAVDLNLATSYVPAFLSFTKCLITATVALYMIPAGGLSILITGLLLDRILLNSDFIVDVNAVTAAVLWAAASNHQRSIHGLHSPAPLVLGVAWTAAGSASAVVKQRHQLYIYAALAAAFSFTHFAPETLGFSLTRATAFNLAVFVQIYWHISTANEEPLVLILLRHASILAAPPIVAAAGTIIPVVIAAASWKQQPPLPPPDTDVEAAALREALASRKEKAGN